jgi:hypothetical protein
MSVCNSVTVKELTYVKDDAPGMAQLARNFCALVLVMVCVCVCVCVCGHLYGVCLSAPVLDSVIRQTCVKGEALDLAQLVGRFCTQACVYVCVRVPVSEFEVCVCLSVRVCACL